jgi:hypothetical protein
MVAYLDLTRVWFKQNHTSHSVSGDVKILPVESSRFSVIIDSAREKEDDFGISNNIFFKILGFGYELNDEAALLVVDDVSLLDEQDTSLLAGDKGALTRFAGAGAIKYAGVIFNTSTGTYVDISFSYRALSYKTVRTE